MRRDGFKFASSAIQSMDNTSYFCKIYKCEGKSMDGKGYCQEHSSPLRTGLVPFMPGSAPVIRTIKKKEEIV